VRTGGKRFDQERPFLTLGIVLAGWLILPVFLKTFSRATFFEATAPFAVSASYARDLQEFWNLKTRSKDELISMGRDLGRLTASYSESVQQNAELESQIQRLEGLLHMPPREHYRQEPARVVRRDFTGWWQTMTIRKGKNYGITVGAPVVFAGGVIGKVSEVHAYTSVVELISSPEVRLAGVVAGDPENRPISYQGGQNPTFGPARGTIEFVPLDTFASATAPKRLVTSGLGGVFPPGLTIGQIVKVELSPDGLFQTGVVELDSRLDSLSEVTVLVPDSPQ
jgi:rod shape-determining protein MreC